MRKLEQTVRSGVRKNSFAIFFGVSVFSIFLLGTDVNAQGRLSKLIGLGNSSAGSNQNQEVPVIVPKPMSISNVNGNRTAKVASASHLPAPPPPTPLASDIRMLTAEPGFDEENDNVFISTDGSERPASASAVQEPAIRIAAADSPSAGIPLPAPLNSSDSAFTASSSEDEETLEEAWNIALTASRELSAKDYERLGADAAVRAARGVGLPKVSNVTGVHTVSKELAIETDVPLSKISPALPDVQLETPVADKDFATSTTALTVPIFMGGRVINMIEAAQAASNAISCGRSISEQDLKYEVAQTYFLVLRVRQLYNVAAEAEQTLAEHEKDAQRLFDNGIVTSNVLLAAQVAYANAKQDLIKAENAVNLSQAAYNRLLWRPFDAPVQIADVEIPPLSGDLETLTQQAVSNRSELTALSYKSQALSAKSRVKRADRLPQVAAIGAYNYIENSHLNENSVFTGSLGVAWTPFDGGVSRNQQSASTFEAMSVTREFEEAESKIRLQVYQCWQDEQETRNRVSVSEKAVEQAAENYRVVNRGFKEGLTGHTEVLDAQTLQTQAMSNLANARYDAILATFHLRRAIESL